MGQLVEGQWVAEDSAAGGTRYQRVASPLRHWITPDGSAGPTGDAGFRAEPGRYHLYASFACPWAHRTLVYRQLKGLADLVGVSYTHWRIADRGWSFEPDEDGLVGDRLFGAGHLMEIYLRHDPRYTGRVTVPVLWDQATGRIVNNESAEIIRMFDTAFAAFRPESPVFGPVSLQAETDRLNAFIYEAINNGVYRAGFAKSQQAYLEAVMPLFAAFDRLEEQLADRPFLLGDHPTEADWRLFPTLARFDIAYHGHFKCNLRRLMDYPRLWTYARRLYQWPGVAETCRFDHMKRHFYESHRHINPSGIVPVGPVIDFDSPVQALERSAFHA